MAGTEIHPAEPRKAEQAEVAEQSRQELQRDEPRARCCHCATKRCLGKAGTGQEPLIINGCKTLLITTTVGSYSIIPAVAAVFSGREYSIST